MAMDESTMNKLEDIVDDIHRRWNGVGLALTVVRQSKGQGQEDEQKRWEECIYTRGKASGQRDWAEDTLCSIASVSKHFTTLALGTLISDGHVLPDGKKLSWNTRVKEVLPGWGLYDSFASEECTLADLGGMRSGMPGHDQGLGDRTPSEILSILPLFRPSAPLRTTCQYFGAGYTLLAEVIPTVTGKSFDEYLRERILEKIGMGDTARPRDWALGSGRYADQYVEDGLQVRGVMGAWKEARRAVTMKGKPEVKRAEEEEKDGVSTIEVPREMFGERRVGFRWLSKGYERFGPGAGHLISTPRDMAKWMKELLDPQVLSPETIAQITKPHAFWTSTGQPTSPEEGIQAYALGLIIYSYRGYTVWMHPGGVPGGASMMFLLPDAQIGVTVLINDGTWGPALIKVVSMRVVDALLGLPARDWEGRGIDAWAGWLGMVDPALEVKMGDGQGMGEMVDIVGKYRNDAYGELDIRRVDDTPPIKAIMGKIRNANAVDLPEDGEIFVARYDKLFWGWILFYGLGGGKWRYWSFQTYRPYVGDSSGKAVDGAEQRSGETVDTVEEGTEGETVLYPWSGGIAVFSEKEGGVGMFGGFTRAGAVDERKEVVLEGLKEGSEVFYEKVQ